MKKYIFFIFICSAMIAGAQPAQKLIRSGNAAYDKGRFKDAEIDYRKALNKAPGSVKGAFNLGNSLYKQNNFEEATSQYSKLVQSETKGAKKPDVFYNLGNSLLENKKYKESVDAYKMALRQNPKDEDTRYNLAYALSKLQQQKNQQQKKQDDKKQQDKQQQQQQQQQQKPKMSKQDANRMLNAMNNNEKRTLDKTKNKPVRAQAQPEKDW